MMYDTYEVFKTIVCCLIDCNVPVKYMSEVNTIKNQAVFVDSNISQTPNSTFLINLRGFPNKGKDTGELAQRILNMNNTLLDIEYNGELYNVEITIKDFTYDGVDNHGRISYSSIVKTALYRKEEN